MRGTSGGVLMAATSEDQMILEIIKHLKERNLKDFNSLLEELQPYDQARLYLNLPEKHRTRFLTLANAEQLADLIQELEQGRQLEILNKLGLEKASRIMDLMDNDDLATLLGGLSREETETFLSVMKKEESRIVMDILEHPPETAGRLMTNRYVWIPVHYTVGETVNKLKSFAEIAETINYLYVIDSDKKLVGVVSYRDLLLAGTGEKISDIMFTRVISVPVDTDQEDVARIIERYDFLAVPVVEENNVLVGIVTVDDVLDVIIKEADEDIGKLSATGNTIDFDTRAWTAARRRLPWLVLLLLLGLISGSIISVFDDTLQQVVALAFFMPMIAGMTGNTGTQSLAVVVRGLVSRDINKNTALRLVMRELGVGIIIGATCGVLIAVIAYLWLGNPVLGLVVGSSLLITLIIGTLAGTVIPLLVYKMKIDPAVASGPLITTLNDVFSLTVYFGVATFFIAYLV